MELFLDRSFGNIPAVWVLTESLIVDKHNGIESLKNDITLFILRELGHQYIHLIPTLGKKTSTKHFDSGRASITLELMDTC